MAVYKDKKRKTWYIRTRIKKHDGTYKEITKRGFSTKAEAQQIEQLLKIDSTKYESVVTFEEVALLYLDEMRKKNSGATYGQRKSDVEKYLIPFFKKKKISQITAMDIKKWHNYIQELRPFANNTLKRFHSTLSAIFKCGMKYYDLPRNVATITGGFILKKEQETKIRFWEQAEFDTFYSYIDDLKFQAIFLLFYYSGIRSGELLVLKWSNLVDDTLSITKSITRGFDNGKYITKVGATKTRKERNVLLPKFLIKKLLEYKTYCENNFPMFTDDFYMFGNRDKWLAKATLQRYFKKIMDKSKVKTIRLHDLRHSHASYLINKNANIVLISERLVLVLC